jgi:hypothetical protein
MIIEYTFDVNKSININKYNIINKPHFHLESNHIYNESP